MPNARSNNPNHQAILDHAPRFLLNGVNAPSLNASVQRSEALFKTMRPTLCQMKSGQRRPLLEQASCGVCVASLFQSYPTSGSQVPQMSDEARLNCKLDQRLPHDELFLRLASARPRLSATEFRSSYSLLKSSTDCFLRFSLLGCRRFSLEPSMLAGVAAMDEDVEFALSIELMRFKSPALGARAFGTPSLPAG